MTFIILFTLIGCSSQPRVDTTSKAVQKAQHTPYLALYDDWRGVPYQLGGTNKNGIDCSAFVQIAFQEIHQTQLPRTTSQQSTLGKKVAYHHVNEGDLVFFKTGYKTRHVGIYIGQNQFMHASTSRGVIISRLDNPYWADKFWQFRQVH
ncbi:NlpC/P60 family protein [Vibrio sp. FNV 38]|nr:NlpC/P60 family protein [Vibrio sp. FNV 38]